jgi:hypothetical protein
MHREIKSLGHFFGITAQRREKGGEEASTHTTSHITKHHLIFYTSWPWRSSQPSLSAAVSRPAAKIQTFRHLRHLPYTLSHRLMPSNHRQPSWFAPPQTIFYPGTKPTFLCHLLTVPSLRCMNSHPFSRPCFQIVRRSGRGVLGDERCGEGEYLVLFSSCSTFSSHPTTIRCCSVGHSKYTIQSHSLDFFLLLQYSMFLPSKNIPHYCVKTYPVKTYPMCYLLVKVRVTHTIVPLQGDERSTSSYHGESGKLYFSHPTIVNWEMFPTITIMLSYIFWPVESICKWYADHMFSGVILLTINKAIRSDRWTK